jgi:hypothetical protein
MHTPRSFAHPLYVDVAVTNATWVLLPPSNAFHLHSPLTSYIDSIILPYKEAKMAGPADATPVVEAQ